MNPYIIVDVLGINEGDNNQYKSCGYTIDISHDTPLEKVIAVAMDAARVTLKKHEKEVLIMHLWFVREQGIRVTVLFNHWGEGWQVINYPPPSDGDIEYLKRLGVNYDRLRT